MPNRFQPIQPGTDQSQLLAVLNKNFAELDNETVTRLFYNSEGNVGGIFGQLPNGLGSGIELFDTAGRASIVAYIDSSGNPVLKVAKSGSDAVTGSDDELILNSAQNNLKIVDEGTVTTTAGTVKWNGPGTGSATGSGTIATIDHDLGFVPIVVASFDQGTGFYTQLPTVENQTNSGVNMTQFFFYAVPDDTQVLIKYKAITYGSGTNTQTSQTYNVKYYLLQETAN